MKYTVALGLILTAANAQAGLIATNMSQIDSRPQTFEQSYIVDSNYKGAVELNLDVWGDFGYRQRNEEFSFYIDDELRVTLHATDHGKFTAINHGTQTSWQFLGSLWISGTQWQQYSADDQVTIKWETGRGVHQFGSNNYVDWQLTAIPEPAAMSLMLFGLAGASRLRKKS